MAEEIDGSIIPLERLAIVRASRNPDICPDCKGVPDALPGGKCHACHNTGKRTVTIPTSDFWSDCDCVRSRVGNALYGATALCPICGGERRVKSDRLREVYDLVLRHQKELRGIDVELPHTQPIGRSLATVLHANGFGAYTDAVGMLRIYVEPAGEKGLYDLFTQDILRPLGTDARLHVSKRKPLEAFHDRLNGFPARDARVWQPLPGQAAMRLWEGA